LHSSPLVEPGMVTSGIARRRNGIVVGFLLPGVVLIAGCGSVTPVSPTAPSPAAVAAQFPSIVGEWGGGGGLTIHYPDGRVSSYGCDGGASVRTQTGGAFSGSGALLGHSLSTDKQCPNSFAFTATMTADGTITAVQLAQPFDRTPGCIALTTATFSSGRASNDGFSIVMNDLALCRGPALDDREPFTLQSDRSVTLSVDRRRGPVVAALPLILPAGLFESLSASQLSRPSG
jgi:hypothetical protein